MWKKLKEFLEIGERPRHYPPGDGFNPPLEGVERMPHWKFILITIAFFTVVLFSGKLIL